MGKLAKHVVIVILGSTAVFGCVLVVAPAQDLSGTCHFAGESATCGSCIAASCRTLVDQCCADGVCRGSVTDLDTCAQTGSASCRAIAYPTSGSPASDALAACILQQCDKACGNVAAIGPPGETPATSTSCVVPTDGKQCRCQVPSTGTTPPNSVTCSSLTVPNALCCADLDWPLAGTNCECRTVTCATSNSGAGCTCTTFGTGPLASCSTGGGCCQGSSGGCECGATTNICTLAPPGTAGFKSVASCGAGTVTCGSMKKRIAGRCSAQ